MLGIRKKKKKKDLFEHPPAFISPFSLPPDTPSTHYGNNIEASKHTTHTSNDRPPYQVF